MMLDGVNGFLPGRYLHITVCAQSTKIVGDYLTYSARRVF